MAKYKSRATRLLEALDLIDQEMSEIDALAEAMESWRDNMTGTNLENTQKYQDDQECAEALRQAHDDIEDGKLEAQSIDFPGIFG